MEQSYKVYFHLGLPKTASTYLQAKIFPKMPVINYFKKHHFKKYRTLQPEDGEIYFFTREMDRGLEKELDRIKETFPENACIILVFRHHFNWIVSKYKNYIRKFGHLTFDEFFSTNGKGNLNMGKYYYSDIVKLVEERFGDRALFLNFEDLKKSPLLLVRKIYDYIGLEEEEIVLSKRVVKRSFSNNQLKIVRKFNTFYRYKPLKTRYRIVNQVHYKYRHFLLHIVAFFARFIPVKTDDLEQEWLNRKAFIEDFFEEDWKQMLKKFS
ncbi:MAG: sulfotransferase [bacterium]